MRPSANKNLITVIAIIAITIAAIVYISVRQAQRLNDTTLQVARSQEVLRHIQKLVETALKNETAVRGFLIAGRDSFPDPLTGYGNDLRREFQKLARVMEGSVFEGGKLDTLSVLIAGRINFSDSMVATRRLSGLNAAISLMETGRDKHFTDEILRIGAEMESKENDLLQKRLRGNDTAVLYLNIILYGMLGLALLAGFVVLRKIQREADRQKANEEKFSALVDAAPDATVVVTEDGIIRMANLQMQKLFGYSRSELIGKPVELLMPESVRDMHVLHRGAYIHDPKVREMGAGMELKALKQDGVAFPVEISLSPIKTQEGLLVSVSIRDITDRKKEKEKFRALLDSAPDATVIVDEHGVIQLINHQAELMFGYTRNEMLRNTVEMLVPGELRDKHTEHRLHFRQTAKVRAMGAGIELKAVKKNGERFPVEISLSPIQTEDGMLVSASIRDISERKVLEDELKKSNAEMEAFTYSVSHDLRAPLRGIIGFTTILEEDYASQLDDEAKRITSIIRANTLKMGILIDDLLSFSRLGKQELVKTLVNSNTLISEVIEQLNTVFAGNIQWKINELPLVHADPHTLKQVWVNLISNAVKYTRTRETPVIEINSYAESGQTVFYVKDNGVGFDETYKDKLFRVFQRLHSADEFEGTGVGLAIVEKIISRHKGHAWATGTEDKGACFYFSLP